VTRQEPDHRSSSSLSESHDATGLREQLSKLQGLVGLSMVMTDNSDVSQIARLASSAVSSLAPVRCDGVHVANRGWLDAAGPCLQRAVRTAVEKQLRRLHGQTGPLEVKGERWAWALPMRSLAGAFGHLVIAADGPVPESEQFLLRVLAQQLGIAVANADSHARQCSTAEELAIVNTRLERGIAIRNRLSETAVAGRGMRGMAETVYELTGYPVVIEDSRGNVLASAGPDTFDPEDQARLRPEELVELGRDDPAPVRVGDRLAVTSGQYGDTFAVLALVDPGDTAGEEERIALVHGATVLALEMSRLQSVLETESRLGGDLLGELLAGTDEEKVRIRAQILGYDLGRQQRVAIVDYPSTVPQDRVFHAVRRATQNLGARPLLGSQRDAVISLAEASFSWHSLRFGVDAELERTDCRIGVGGICEGASEVQRSYREAQLALQLMSFGRRRPSVVLFDELGVFEILADTKDPKTIQRFVRRWLGALLDYDEGRSTELVPTLASYLEAGGNYAHSARVLGVHRNTLRYRLKRIQEISGYDLGEPDVQFNLQLAARAWRTSTAFDVLNADHP
jgi:sugar diacid utilization regulator